MVDFKVDFETAEKEFNIFIDEMNILIDVESLDADELSAYNKQKGRLVKAIQRGDLIFNSDGEAVLTPSHKRSKYSSAITFHERTGADMMAMDGKKLNRDVAKTYAILASMCKVNASVFADLAGYDIKVCEAIFAFLMD